ncbi:hypothetical protein MBEHAL_0457 [Halarchaeum acidiphilum MH1-52-1]|uniref:Uncharacterized protein n=1 Tax=Halarchaeum acidiphilum MH1-52-1 TaxID=1261545 RepID=U2YSH5_9EURY|nr:hypothetical protein MBEHAL_0457 [Halarchaeum acidiphilum MH1-52-1]
MNGPTRASLLHPDEPDAAEPLALGAVLADANEHEFLREVADGCEHASARARLFEDASGTVGAAQVRYAAS